MRSLLIAALIVAPAATLAQPANTAGAPTQYSSQSDAASKCGGDTVVWANATSKALHLSGDRYFGKSKHGFFTCEKQALSAGYHVAGHRKKHAAKSA